MISFSLTKGAATIYHQIKTTHLVILVYIVFEQKGSFFLQSNATLARMKYCSRHASFALPLFLGFCFLMLGNCRKSDVLQANCRRLKVNSTGFLPVLEQEMCVFTICSEQKHVMYRHGCVSPWKNHCNFMKNGAKFVCTSLPI